MHVFRSGKNAAPFEEAVTMRSHGRIPRRPILGTVAALGAGLLPGCTSGAVDKRTASAAGAGSKTGSAVLKVWLLGTGGPELSTERQGMSTLIEAGGQRLLFDVGRGATQNMYESRISPKDVTKVFLTHLHNDHYEDLPALWLTPWFLLGRKERLQVWGPAGTAGMVEGMRAMYAHDVEHRSNDLFKKDDLKVRVHDVRAGVVYDEGGVKVTAFTVEHKEGNPAYGYRLDYAGRSVLLSGDTTYDPHVVEHGMGVDVLIHNVIAFNKKLTVSGDRKAIEAKLTTPEQAARVFSKTRPRLAVYSHIAKKHLHGKEGDEQIVRRTRKAGYDGRLQMGQDRMTIEIGDEVTVKPPASTADLPELDGPDVRL
ncbi:MBL fold metallo-hydrolase [Streptomyces sp. NPDC017993]|uniref:MBL fold metallo-hydrolase n=1 Tax=Streptomyces sp. NPDC017993 TaxID=3365027 RepID=UPI0037875418